MQEKIMTAYRSKNGDSIIIIEGKHCLKKINNTTDEVIIYDNVDKLYSKAKKLSQIFTEDQPVHVYQTYEEYKNMH